MKKISLGGVALVCAFCSLYAQDPRERNYFYEILDPKHEPKPLVEGFAQERITENLNRGLAVVPGRQIRVSQLAFAGIGCSRHGFPCIS